MIALRPLLPNRRANGAEWLDRANPKEYRKVGNQFYSPYARKLKQRRKMELFQKFGSKFYVYYQLCTQTI